MENSVFHNSPVAKVLDHDALEQRGSDRGVPNALWIHDDDWPIAAHAEAGRLPALNATRPEQESLALQERWKQAIELTTALIGRAESPNAHEHVARVRVHRWRRSDRRRHESG